MSSTEGAQQQSAPPEHRKHPCVLCQQRKVKCDRNEPCRNCMKARVECISAATLPPRKRKRRFPEAELLARLRRYEHHLKNYGADLDAINQENINSGPDTTKFSNTNQGLGSFKSSTSGSPAPIDALSPEDPAVRSLSVRRSLRHVDNNLNITVSEEFRDAEELFDGSSEDEMYNPSYPLNIKMPEGLAGELEGEDILFGPPHKGSLKSLHPSPIQIFRLWQTFLDNINPLVKIFHAPSVQHNVLEATSDLENIPKNTEALLFGIYATAAMSMEDETSEKIFGQEKEVVLARFQIGLRHALQNAGYLRSSDIVVLQAFTLYLLSCLQMVIDPRSLFCLTGCAVRIAQRMGLSTDGTNYAIPPFEVEMRRRLWWQIVFIDTRVAERSGAGTSILQYTWNTKFPSNINDSDLYPDMKDPPVENPGITEMIFVRLRCEITDFVQQCRKLDTLMASDEAVEELSRRLERDYLSFCDPLVPLHVMSSTMVRSTMCKLAMGRRAPHFMMESGNGLSPVEKDKLFNISLQMLEIHNSTMKNLSLQRFFWHIYNYFPFPAHLYLLCALRYRTNDDLADRAWQQLSDSAETRMNLGDPHPTPFFANKRFSKKDSFVDLALGNIALKAWDARQAASSQVLQVPRFISQCRNKLAAKKSEGKMASINETSPMEQSDQAFGGQFSSQFPMLDANSLNMGSGFGQSVIPEIFPGGISPPVWDFWNNMMQAGDSMQGVDAMPPPYNYYEN